MNTAELSAHTELPVPVELACQRDKFDYVPGSCSDGRKLGIAVGTGGGAGPISLAFLAALHEKGVTKNADAWYGGSIAGINIAATVANQVEVAMGGYKDMTEKGFVKKSRFLRIMDMSILERRLKDESTGLDTDAVVRSPIPIKVGVTRLSGGIEPYTFDLTELNPDDVVDVLLWSCSIPGLCGPARRDKKGIGPGKNAAYCDFGLSKLSAVHEAAEDGCTDIIYLSNQPYGVDKYRKWQVALFGALMTPYDPLAIPKFDAIVRNQIKSREPFRDGSFRYGEAAVVSFYPPAPQKPSESLPGLLNMDPKKIKTGFEVAKLHILNKLAGVFPAKINNIEPSIA